MGAFLLVEESVAAGLGNGLVARKVLPKKEFERLFAKDRGFYNDPYIDPAAKALLNQLLAYVPEAAA